MRSILVALLLALFSTSAGAVVYYAGAFRSQAPLSACGNGVDDDGDGATDYPADSGCSSADDTSELNLDTECDNGLDDDADGQTDYPDDAQCTNSADDQEAGSPPAAACNDTLDNDGDGATDLDDTGCDDAADTNELGSAACDDGIDNDGDGDTDFPGDVDCLSTTDNDESAGAASTVSAAITATPVQGATCVAPCVVHLDATATTDTDSTRPFHTLEYYWDGGPSLSGNWSYGAQSSKRFRRGGITGVVYTTPGTKNITLEAKASDGDVDDAGATVTVADPLTTFGSRLHCFRNGTSGTFAGCPLDTTGDGTCDVHTSNCHSSESDWEDALADCSATTDMVACYFRRGDTFNASGATTLYGSGSSGDPGIIDAFGTGARPIVTGGGALALRPYWTIASLDMRPTSLAVAYSIAADLDRITVYDVVSTDTFSCFTTATGGAAGHNEFLSSIGNNCTLTTAGEPATANLIRGANTLFIGNRIDNQWRGEFNVRLMHVYHAAIQDNTLVRAGATAGGGLAGNRNPIQLRAWANCGGAGPPASDSQYLTLSDNVMTYVGDSAATTAIRTTQDNVATSTLGGCADGTPMDMMDLVIERNFAAFDGTGSAESLSTGFINAQGGRFTVRNNVFDAQGLTSTSPTNRFMYHHPSYTTCAGCTSDEMVVVGNTIYWDDDTNRPFQVCYSAEGAGHVCHNNLVWATNDSATAGNVDDTGTGWTAGASFDNLFATANPFTAVPPADQLTVASDFQLAAGASTSLDQTTAAELVAPLQLDFGGNCRPDSVSYDIGAWERGAIPCQNPTSIIGMNSDALDENEEGIVFADAIDNSAQIQQPLADPTISRWETFWLSYQTNMTTAVPGTAIPTDVNGFPSVDIPYNPSGTNLVARMELMEQDTGRPVAYPAGSYTLSFDGTGTVQLTGDGTVTCTGTDASCAVTITPTAGSSSGVKLWITSSDPGNLGDPITDIHLYLPGYTSADTFYRPYVNALRPFSFLRAMNHQRVNHFPCSNLAHSGTNAESTSCEHTWAGRQTTSGIQAGRRGLAWEYQIALANAADVDLWVTIPHAANDTYVSTLAALLKSTLNGKVYVELSNEVWNGDFDQEGYFTNVGVAAGWGAGATAQRRAYVHRAAEVMDLFDAEFTGGDAARLVKVLGSARGTGDTAALITALGSATYNPTSAVFDAIAINVYFGGTGSTATAILDATETALAATEATIDSEFTAIDAYGAEMFGYEGGPIMETMTDPYILANDDDRMEGIVEDMYDLWFANGGSTAALGFLMRDNLNGGALRYPRQPLSDAPRYRGYLGSIENHAQ